MKPTNKTSLFFTKGIGAEEVNKLKQSVSAMLRETKIKLAFVLFQRFWAITTTL
jgi:hypothetical protein